MFGIIHLESMFCLRKNQVLDLHKQKQKTAPVWNLKWRCRPLSYFFFTCFSHIFAIANQLPGFYISRLANVENFFNLNINVRKIDNSLVWHATENLVFTASLVPQCQIWIQLIHFTTPTVTSEILILKIEMLLEFQNKANVEITGF